MSIPRILVIDDDRMTRQLLSRALAKEGFEVLDCPDAREALQLIESVRPALLVSDYEMPEFNGAQLCELVRQHQEAEISDLPVILLTAHAGEQHEVECLRAGANDFVTKPVNPAILRARIDTHLRLHALRQQLQAQNAELEEYRRSREADLEAAQTTQQAILPVRPPQIAGWDVAAYFQPVIHVGGDMYDWMRLPDGSWFFWIADATGHGASAALLTTLTKLVFRHAATEARASPCDILKAANAEFFGTLRGKSFMTAACLVAEPETGRICFAGAGHPPLLIHRISGEATLLPSQAPPIGILPQLQCEEVCTTLAVGETALLYTDGLYSITGADGERLTPAQLPTMVPTEAVSAEDFLNQIVNELFTRHGSPALPDDLAAVALRRV
jgi:serine phosphatase RsbU (regulator of sigma subunit)